MRVQGIFSVSVRMPPAITSNGRRKESSAPARSLRSVNTTSPAQLEQAHVQSAKSASAEC